jgi:hypothetical protein
MYGFDILAETLESISYFIEALVYDNFRINSYNTNDHKILLNENDVGNYLKKLELI